MSQTTLTIGHPQLIHKTLIALAVDMQSIVIFSISGTMLGWIYEHTRAIDFAEGYTIYYDALYNESDLAPVLKDGDYYRTHFKIDGTISDREWGLKCTFIYPGAGPTHTLPIIANEHLF